MNIGFFSETYRPDINGVITSIDTFREELEKAGHNVYIFAPGSELFGRANKGRRERRVFRFNSFSYPFYRSIRVALPLNWAVQRRIRKLKLDVIHSHTPFSMGLFASFVSWQQKIPHVHTYHTLYPEYVKFYFPGFKKWNQRAAEKLSAVFCNKVDEVIAPSEGIQKKLKGYGIKTPISVLPTGVESRFFDIADTKNVIRKRYGIPVDAPLVITVARLGKEKSIDYLLKAFVQIRRFSPDARYLIVGDGPARADLETLARELGVMDHVTFTGFMPDRDDVIRAYSTADVFIFASKTDTQCLTLLEAAATGLPLVARYDTPLETALHHEVNGYFVRETQNKFAWKVHRLLDDKKLNQKFGKASLKIAKGESAQKRADELQEIYQRAITRRITDKLSQHEQDFLKTLGVG